MARFLELNLLGPVEIRQDGEPISTPVPAKTVALLCRLAVTGRSFPRSSLAGLFWGDVSEEHARANLSKALSTLRLLFPDHLLIARQSVAFNRDSPYGLDVEAFEAGTGEGSVEALQRAVQLYRGEFLANLDVPGAAEFELWVTAERVRLRDAAVRALYTLSAHFSGQGEAGRALAIEYTGRLLYLEPWREEAHRQMMRLLALDGQRGAALAQFERCRQMLASELDVEPGAETVALYELIRDDQYSPEPRESAMPARSDADGAAAPGRPPPHNLPASLSAFLGREYELEALERLLAREDVRLVSIVGMGGMGKTRLALEAARFQVGRFPDGVYFVPLVGVDSVENIPSAIADALHLSFYSTEAPLQQLANYLQPRRMLLILDNFEHLVTGSAVITNVLAAAPGLKVVVTSRVNLRLSGETRLSLSGMDVQSWQTVAQARSASAIQLLEQSARRVRPEFRLNEANLEAASTLCRLLQGMPLGIELAASWVDVMPLAEIAQGLRVESEFLTTDFQDLPERHRSLQAVLEQSINLLGAQDREIFLRLCVFRGGFTREAAQRVAGADTLSLKTMVNKSLVRRESGERYSIHELLRQFGNAEFQNDEENYVRVRDEHARCYCDFLKGLDADLNLGEAQRACRQIELELGNVHLAWEWACGHGMVDDLIGAEYPIFLFREYQNRFEEMEQMYETAIWRLLSFEASPKRDFLLSGILRSRAWTALRFGRIELGLALGGESWDYLMRSGLPLQPVTGNDPRAPLTVLHTLSGSYALARRAGEEMLAFHQARGDGVKSILAYYALSTLELAEGNYERVREYGRAARNDFRSTGHRYLWSYFLNNWGNAERALGNLDEAERLFRESYSHMRDLGSTEGMMTALRNLATIAIQQEDFDNAQALLEQSLATYRDLGDIGGVAAALEALGQIALLRKDFAQAARSLADALQTSGTSLPATTLSILTLVGQMLMETGHCEQGRHYLVQVTFHPAGSQEIRDRAQQLMSGYGLEVTTEPERRALGTLLDEALRLLRSCEWRVGT